MRDAPGSLARAFRVPRHYLPPRVASVFSSFVPGLFQLSPSICSDSRRLSGTRRAHIFSRSVGIARERETLVERRLLDGSTSAACPSSVRSRNARGQINFREQSSSVSNFLRDCDLESREKAEIFGEIQSFTFSVIGAHKERDSFALSYSIANVQEEKKVS